MRFHTTHHIYKFAVRKKVFEHIFFLEKSPVQPLAREEPGVREQEQPADTVR